MTWKYFMPDNGETVDDAIPIMRARYDLGRHAIVEDPATCHDHEDAAEAAANQYKSNGAEWYEGTQTIAVVDKDGQVEVFEVEIEYEPTFTARKVEAKR